MLFGGGGPALVLRYESCGGLFNQHYCQLAGLTMAAALGAHAVVMPPALARNRCAGGRPTQRAVQYPSFGSKIAVLRAQ